MPSAGSRRRKEQSYRSVISDIFDGSILSLVQCLTCDRVGAWAAEGRSAFCSLGRAHRDEGWGVGSPPRAPAFPLGEGPGCKSSVSKVWGAGLLPLPRRLVAGIQGTDSAGSGRAEPWKVETQADL